MINKIMSLLSLFGFNRTKYAEYMGMSKSSLCNKIKRESWTAKDLILLAEMTNSKLAIVDQNDKVLVTFDKEDLQTKNA